MSNTIPSGSLGMLRKVAGRYCAPVPCGKAQHRTGPLVVHHPHCRTLSRHVVVDHQVFILLLSPRSRGRVLCGSVVVLWVVLCSPRLEFCGFCTSETMLSPRRWAGGALHAHIQAPGCPRPVVRAAQYRRTGGVMLPGGCAGGKAHGKIRVANPGTL
jgi:hypothetical protein